MEKGVPVIVRAEWQETTDKPCDTGSAVDVMANEPAWCHFDWSSCDPSYIKNTGLHAYSREAIAQRGEVAMQWLRGRSEKIIAVVSHSGFLRSGVSGKSYENADYRVFEFGKEDGKLVESEETEKKGGGLGKSPLTCEVIWPKHYPLTERTNAPSL